jgi:hypothetical protein
LAGDKEEGAHSVGLGWKAHQRHGLHHCAQASSEFDEALGGEGCHGAAGVPAAT